MDPPQAEKPAVPKFSSFKPKPPPPAPPKEPSPNHDDEKHRRRRDHHEDRERDHKSHRDRHSRSHRDDRDRRHRDRDRDHREHREREKRDERRHKHKHESDTRREERRDDRAVAERPAQKQAVGDDVIYVIDRKGDLANLQYGRLHQYSVPPYYRAGYGSVLGLPSYARIDRFSSDDRTIIIDMRRRHGGSERQLLSKRFFGKEAPILRLVKPTHADTTGELDQNQDFIPVRSLKRKRGSESPEPEAEKIDYRSIEGKAKPPNQPEDSDLEYASDDVDAGSHADFFSETKQRNALLTRRVQDEPNDLQTWLDLVEHQESMIRIGSSDTHRQLKSSELHALASLRFDIYQRALKVLKSERLVAGLMDESSKIHQREEHFNRWKEVLSENRESTTLWMKYLDALQTNLAEFHFEDCRSKFLECLKIISKSTTREAQHLRVYVFLRLTSLMKHAGYHERAIALWQALLELQLFRPPTFGEDTPKSSILQDFEEFWESECPRFGETGAVGWANARQDGVFPDPPESTIQDEEGDISLRRLFESFSQKETHRMNVLQWPGRTTDEFGEDDPFHVVLYSDIKNELQLLVERLPPTLLVEAYLCFWGLPPLPSDLQTRSWWLDPFLRSEKLNATVSKHLLLTTSAEPEVDSHYELDNWNPPAECFQVTTNDLFSKGFFSGTRNQEQLEWLSRSLKTLASSISDDAVAEYYLAFEWHCNPTGAAKAAKALLKKRSSSLRLYNAYALIESRSGKSEAANRVFSMAIGMSNQLPAEARKHTILLWRSWIWEALRTDDLKSARHRLSSIGDAKPEPEARSTDDDDDKFHPATVLKVRNTLVEGRDHSISVGDTTLAVYYAECLALFTYIQEGSNIEAALSTFLEMSSLLQARGHLHSAANEIAHQLQCQLLSYHSKRVKLFKPVITRSVVHESITLFPNNTKFLAMYAANEARFRVDDRVRAIMHDVVLQQDQSIVGWLFAVYSELKRGENLGGTTHAVRAAFEKAVDSESGKKSSALWTSYVLYLVSTADRAAAKRVFFRGLLHLPYSKAYLMLAFAHLVDDLDFKELRSVYNTLQEKELRVHVEIEEEIEDVQRAIDRRRRSLPAVVVESE
ncbi:Protein NRDE2-like protein [Lasiodiplodia theobromae]|uniref:Protein NRDE2-like protein n=1 Tax=Lasiodiplodia theobromae TaxID=45133 RepID=A0A5N5D1W8_9PEZI|nr:Protein NRDE2-like protein [Lasiodiplodia theobromae]